MKIIKELQCKSVSGGAGIYVPPKSPANTVKFGGSGGSSSPTTAALNVPGKKWPYSYPVPLKGYVW